MSHPFTLCTYVLHPPTFALVSFHPSFVPMSHSFMPFHPLHPSFPCCAPHAISPFHLLCPLQPCLMPMPHALVPFHPLHPSCTWLVPFCSLCPCLVSSHLSPFVFISCTLLPFTPFVLMLHAPSPFVPFMRMCHTLLTLHPCPDPCPLCALPMLNTQMTNDWFTPNNHYLYLSWVWRTPRAWGTKSARVWKGAKLGFWVPTTSQCKKFKQVWLDL